MSDTICLFMSVPLHPGKISRAFITDDKHLCSGSDSRSPPEAVRRQRWLCGGTAWASSVSTSTLKASWQMWSPLALLGRQAWDRGAGWWRSARWLWPRSRTSRWLTCCARLSLSKWSSSSPTKTELQGGNFSPSPCSYRTQPHQCALKSAGFNQQIHQQTERWRRSLHCVCESIELCDTD